MKAETLAIFFFPKKKIARVSTFMAKPFIAPYKFFFCCSCESSLSGHKVEIFAIFFFSKKKKCQEFRLSWPSRLSGHKVEIFAMFFFFEKNGMSFSLAKPVIAPSSSSLDLKHLQLGR